MRLIPRLPFAPLLFLLACAHGNLDDAEVVGYYCADVFNPFLEAAHACCTESDQQTPQYMLTVAFLAGYQQSCVVRLGQSAELARIRYDSLAAWQCLNLIEVATYGTPCGTAAPDISGLLRLWCRDVIIGLEGEEEPCAGSWECAPGLVCLEARPGVDGVCSPPSAVGTACGPSEVDASLAGMDLPFGFRSECEAGSACLGGTCTATLTSGPCSSEGECAAGLHCHLGTCGLAGRSAAGELCLSDGDCQSSLYCQLNGDAGTCTALKLDGDSCSPQAPTRECLGLCTMEGVCASYCASG